MTQNKKINTKLLLLAASMLLVKLSVASLNPESCQQYLGKLNGFSSSKSMRMYGGHEVKPHEFPFLVLIDEKCAGAIIGPFQIITTADCVLDYFVPKKGTPLKLISKMKVMKSEHDRFSQDGEVKMVIVNMVTHENYTDEGAKGIANNIALLETREPLYSQDDLHNETSLARPIEIDCRPIADDQLLYVAGWGASHPEKDELNNVPLWHLVKKVPNDLCKCYLSKYDMELADGSLCASFESGAGTICHGDSGDPLFRVTPDGRLRLVGLASYYKLPCVHGKVPAVYVNLADHTKWILESQTK